MPNRQFRLTLAVLLLSLPLEAQLPPADLAQGNHAIIAGTGESGFTGDGGPAASATLVKPQGILLDRNGHLVFADVSSEIGTIVRRIDRTTGVIAAVAGDGGTEFDLFGASGPALEFSLAEIGDLAEDEQGNLYLSETAQRRIIRVDTAGTVSMTEGAEGMFGFSPLSGPTGLHVSGGTLYIADNHQIFKHDLAAGTTTRIAGGLFDGFSGDNGRATFSRLNTVGDLATDADGHLFFADTGNGRIRRIDANTDTITTVANIADFPALPDSSVTRTITDLAITGDGSLLIAETGRVWRQTPAGEIIPLAGTGETSGSSNGDLATETPFNIISIAFDEAGNLYVGDASRTIRFIAGAITVIEEPITVIETPPEVPATPTPDFDGNGSVDFSDFLEFASAFGKTTSDSDFDGKFDLDASGDIGFGDFLQFAAAFGT